MILDDLMKSDWSTLLLSVAYAVIGIYIGHILFHSSLAMIFFSAMPLSHYIYNSLKSRRRVHKNELIKIYLYSFIGMAIVFGAASKYISLSELTVVGNAYNPYSAFGSVLMNNLKVMFVCFAMSLIYGTGAAFILALNAVMAGKLFASLLSSNIEVAVLYVPHTSVEIFAYFLGALSGGMLASAVIGSRAFGRDFGKIALDASSVYTIGVAFLMFAAFLETFVLPAMLGKIPW